MSCHKPNCKALAYVVTKERKLSPPVVWCKEHWLASELPPCYFEVAFLTRDIQVPGDKGRPMVFELRKEAK